MHKRGQGLSTGAIVLIILGVIVLAILAFGFSLGWNKLVPFLSKGNNVQTVSTQCSAACATSTKFDYCTNNLNITANGKTYEGTCNDFANNAGAVKVFTKGTKGSTTASASDVSSFGVASCSSITC